MRAITLSFWTKVITACIVLAGLFIRLLEFARNRSLYLDEANLVRNVAERDFSGFLQSLDYHQYAPPIFLSLVKLSTLLFGQGEYALRLWPLLAGMLAVLFFWRLTQAWSFRPLVSFFANALFAGSSLAILYASSAKQYSTDMLVTVALIYLADRDLREGRSYSWLRWLVIGVLAPWISMPSVFILSGVGLAFWWPTIRDCGRWVWQKRTTWWTLSILAWIISFGIYYWLLLRNDIESDFLQQWHEDHFLPLIPLSAEALMRFGHIGLGLFKTAFGFTGVALVSGILFFLLGVFRLVRHSILAWLLLTPLLACWIASALQQYSMMPRLLSFAFPILWLVAAWGLQWMLEAGNKVLPWALLPIVLLIVGIQGGWKLFWQPMEVEYTREALDEISRQWQPGDGLFIFRWAEPAYAYYSQHHPDRERYQFAPSYHNPTSLGYEKAEAEQRLGQVERTWLLYTHVHNDAEKAPMLTDINQVEPSNNIFIILSLPGTYLYLIRPNE